MSFDQDPNEQANISGADLAILIDELATLSAALQTQAEEAAKLMAQRDNLHAIVCQCLDALENGAGATTECSIEFLADAPAEVGAVVAGLKRQRDELRVAAQAVVDRWDSPTWKCVPPTGEFINRLRAAITNATKGEA